MQRIRYRPRASSAAVRHRARSQAGDTLIEVLIAAVIIGGASVALLGTLTTAIAASGEQKTLSVEDTLLRAFAETAKQQIELSTTPTYANNCPTTYNVNFTQVSGYNVAINPSSVPSGQLPGIEYWNQSASAFQTTCVSHTPDNDLQLITITANVCPDGMTTCPMTTSSPVQQSLSFVVRNPNYAP